MASSPHVNPGDGSDVVSWVNPDSSVGARFDSWGRRRQNAVATSPTVAAGAAAGTSPTVSLGSGSSDEFGTVSVTAGTGSPAAGTLATVTFALPYATTPALGLAFENDSEATQLGVYATVSTTALTIKTRTAVAASADVYSISYLIVGGP